MVCSERPPPVFILGQPNPVHIPTSHFLEIHPNIIHPSTPRSPQWPKVHSYRFKCSRIVVTQKCPFAVSHQPSAWRRATISSCFSSISTSLSRVLLLSRAETVARNLLHGFGRFWCVRNMSTRTLASKFWTLFAGPYMTYTYLLYGTESFLRS